MKCNITVEGIEYPVPMWEVGERAPLDDKQLLNDLNGVPSWGI